MDNETRGAEEPALDSKRYTTPRWVKVFGTIVTVVILLFIVLRFSVFANH